MKIIGKNRWEAINWVQDNLGPTTPRNVAEDTLKVLLGEGLVEDDIDEMVLLEDLDQEELRKRARNTVATNDMRKMRRSRVAASMKFGNMHHRNHQHQKHAMTQQRQDHHEHQKHQRNQNQQHPLQELQGDIDDAPPAPIRDPGKGKGKR